MEKWKGLVLLAAMAAGGAVAAESAPAEFAASFEVRPDRFVDKAKIGFGFELWETAPFESAKLYFGVEGPDVLYGPKNLVCGMDTAFRTGLWHHVAVAYREKDNTARVYIDGELMGVATTVSAEPVGVAAFKNAPKAAKDFPGEIRNVKTWEKIPDDAELLPAATIGPIRDAAFAVETSLVKGFDQKQPASGILPVSIDRHSPDKHVPFKTPPDAAVLKELKVAAAQGEIEDASFLVLPFRDVKKFHVRVTDLKGDAGSLPAAVADVRIVKNLLEGRYGWTRYLTAGQYAPTMTPELLVHDDRLTYIDKMTHLQMLRLSYPEGERYIPVSDIGSEETYPKFNYDLEPVIDAETLLPFDLERRKYTQLWLTFRVPADAKGGVYRGEIALTADGKTLETVPLALTVHPFRLPRPGCHHDPDRTFVSHWMGHYHLRDKLTGCNYSAGGCSLSNAIRRTYAEFRNFAEHNSAYPASVSLAADDPTIPDIQLDIQKAAGCEMKPLFADIGVVGEGEFPTWPLFPPKEIEDQSVEANLELWKKEMADYSNRVARAVARTERKVGHRDYLYYGWDEASPGVVRREMPRFATLNHFGGTSLISSGVAAEAAFIVDINDAPNFFNAEQSRRWHESGGRIFSYAAPHSGPECPDIWRRSRGLGSYYADLDGVCEYIWYEAVHVWNETILSGTYRNLMMVFPTTEGVLDTVQWEAYREGMDDIRYVTLLMRVARAATKAKDAALAKEGRAAVQWIETRSWEKDDLDALRLEAARRIVALNGALAKTGFDIASVTDLPPAPSPLAVKIPAPDPAASAADLEKDAARFAQLGAADVAAAFYAAAARKSAGEKAARLYISAAEESMRWRDLAGALAAVDAGVALGKDAGGAFKRLRILRALLPCRTRGWLVPDRKTVEAAEPVVRKYATAEDTYEFLHAELACGEAAKAAEGFAALFEKVKQRNPRIDAARSAAEAHAAAGNHKESARWYSQAADIEDYIKPHRDLLRRAGEQAMLAKEYAFALKIYQKLLDHINKSRESSLHAAVKKQVVALTKLTGRKGGGPSADPDASEEPISLDEEL